MTPADLRSSAAIEVACFNPRDNTAYKIKFASEEVAKFRGDSGGDLVTDPTLILQLWLAFVEEWHRGKKRPDAVAHLDYPFKWFVPFEVPTHRNIHVEGAIKQMQVPGPMKVYVFIAVPRKM